MEDNQAHPRAAQDIAQRRRDTRLHGLHGAHHSLARRGVQALRAALAQDSRHIFDRRADSVPALNAHTGPRRERCFRRAV